MMIMERKERVQRVRAGPVGQVTNLVAENGLKLTHFTSHPISLQSTQY
jgi:hypothetical protein